MRSNPEQDPESPEDQIPSETTDFIRKRSLDLKTISINQKNSQDVIISERETNNQNSKDLSTDASVEEDKGWKSYMGIALTMCSGLMFAIVGLIVKYLKGYHALNLGFFRFQGLFLTSIPFLLYVLFVRKQPVLKPIWPITDRSKFKTMAVLFGRAFTGCVAVISHFYAIQYMTVADAMVIGSCSPVFVTIVAHLFLGEKWGVFPVLIALLTIFGVGIIARPPLITGKEEYDMDTLIGAGFAIGRMLMTSLAIVFVRYLRGVHVAVVLFFTGGLQLLQNTSISVIMGVFSLPTDPYHLGLGVMIGLTSFIGQMCMTLALKCENAGPFAIVRTCDAIFAFILQFVFLGVIPDIFSLVGAAVIIAAVSLTVFRKWLGSLPQGHKARTTYWLVLK